MFSRFSFVSPGKWVAGYGVAFSLLILLLAGLEMAGAGQKLLGYVIVLPPLVVYAVIGIGARTRNIQDYYVAGRRVPGLYNGLASAADWMSAASFLGLAGTLYLFGYGGLAFVLGWTGGFVLVAILLAPYLRKFGQYTIPDFLGARYGGHAARLFGVLVLVVASCLYIVAQLVGIGLITQRFLGLSFEMAVFAGLTGLLVCSLLGGMRAVTWTQVAQYVVLVVAFVVPVTVLSIKQTGSPFALFSYGSALEEIEKIEGGLGLARTYTSAFLNEAGQFDITAAINFFMLAFCLMVGTASLPHILMRYFTTPTVRAARNSVAWCLFFILLLYLMAPAYAAFTKLEVYRSVIGHSVADLPAWIKAWALPSPYGGIPWIEVVDLNGDGFIQAGEFRILSDAVVLAAPEISGMPYVITGLVAAGGLAAALSTADGLLLAIANALSHDVYYKVIDPNADARRRLIISRVFLIFVAAMAAWGAGALGANILFLVSWAFSIAGSGLFAPLVLGIWWKRCGPVAGVAGIIVGFVVCLFVLIATEFYGPWVRSALGSWGEVHIVAARGREVAHVWGIDNIAIGVIGVPASFLAMWLATLFARPASPEVQEMVDSIRTPKGKVANLDQLP
ncbi:VC_2705 family sodium/solute symporter [Reyranella sp. CPCC 100927]|uniref:VC_2705 family sodium/solute symporter n=1 Tax=Reyranella sp. CPCC 100927 TaxID=2599616 RepID=UPI0011B7506F|nr:VC_2705 family sodium/solute symporter [Reyranella sp. CPCC 100927]TWS99922.1 sodium/solute symporter [Reyranella sp. CPCC 100927]